MTLPRTLLAHLNQVPFIDRHVYVAKHGPARGLKRQGGMGWLPSFLPRTHEWDAEEAFLAALDWKGLTVYDVGGDQGLFTLFFADRVGPHGRVVVLEPNPRSVRRIAENVRHNGFGNVTLLPIGASDRSARVRFAFPRIEPARGSAAPRVADVIAAEADAAVCEIDVRPLDDEIRQRALPVPHFIKIDIEGMEYAALVGMKETLRKHRPRLSIEIHGVGLDEKRDNVRRVVALLQELGYRIRHIESTTNIDTSNADRAGEGHLYCEPR